MTSNTEGRRLDSNKEPIRALSVAESLDHTQGRRRLASNKLEPIRALSVAESPEQLISDLGWKTAGDDQVTNNIYLNLHIHNHAAGNTSYGNSSSPKRFNYEADEPSFAMVSHVTAVDFGNKLVKRYFSAEKHVDEQHNLVTYSETRSTVKSAAHALTLGRSSKRATHVIILFDTGLLQRFAPAWPPRIHLHAVENLIKNLGPDFECTKSKVRKDGFSLYLFAIKTRGVRFSQICFESWIKIFYWAHHLEASTDNMIASLLSFLTSPSSVLENALNIGKMLLGL